MLDPSLMAKLWKALIEMYGHKFTSAYGEVPNDTWALALSGFEWHHLAQGVRACFRREDNWPPTLPEFVEMCMPAKTPSSLYFPDSVKALPPPRPSREFAEKRIAEIRQKLKVNQ